MPPALAELLPALVVSGVVLLFALYIAMVLRGEDDPKTRDGPEGRAEEIAPSVPVRTTARAPKPPPRLRPPAGSVASGTSSSADSGPDELIRVLEDGPDYRRQAAAKALSVPFAGTEDRRVVTALCGLVRFEDASVAARAEAWCALRVVMGADLSWEEEVQVRQRFPEGVDLDWMDEAEA